jgi:hypothetical protein
VPRLRQGVNTKEKEGFYRAIPPTIFIYNQTFFLTMKKGQASGAAILLAIIAALIVMFIVLSPPSERDEILTGTPSGTGGSGSGGSGSTSDGKVLLKESPGRLDYLNQKDVEHSLPAINIYTREESKVIAQKNIARARKRVFSEETTDFAFMIDNLNNVENLLLSFNAVEVVGELIVSLNGEVIYRAVPSKGALPPIKLAKNSLKQSNIIVFAVSSPGIALWRTHEALVSEIKIIGDVTNLDAQKSRSVFLVSETEKRNLESVKLQFQPTCVTGDVGKLSIEINGKSIYDSVPDCDIPMVPIEFSPLQINQGENELIFSTLKGTYQLSHVAIRSNLRGVDFPTYYFELSFEEYQKVKDKKLRVRVKMSFVDITADKRGEIIFNGRTRHFDTEEVSFTIDLSEDIVQGSNAIKIKPKKTLEIRELKAELLK